VQYTPTGYAAAKENAGALSLAEYIRRRTERKHVPASGPAPEHLRELSFALHRAGASVQELVDQIRKIGVNVNQLAAIANLTRHLPLARELREALRTTDEKIEEAVRHPRLLTIDGKIAQAIELLIR
jgi:hypothetical protein